MTTYNEKDFVSFIKIDEKILLKLRPLLEELNIESSNELVMNIFTSGRVVNLQPCGLPQITHNNYTYKLEKDENGNCWINETKENNTTRLSFRPSDDVLTYTGNNTRLNEMRFFFDDVGHRCELYNAVLKQVGDGYQWVKASSSCPLLVSR